MTAPLAPLTTLRRLAMTVQLHDSFAFAQRRDATTPEGRIAFSRRDDAEAYLRFWAGESGAMSALRRVLALREPGTVSSAFSDEPLLRTLAGLLVTGALIAIERRSDVPRAAGESSASAASTAAAPAAARIPISPVTPPLRPVAPTLAALEDVQIEGAQVLPELMQTIEQIDVTMAQITLATVSLEPAPSGVAAIGVATQTAASSITSTLGAL